MTSLRNPEGKTPEELRAMARLLGMDDEDYFIKEQKEHERQKQKGRKEKSNTGS